MPACPLCRSSSINLRFRGDLRVGLGSCPQCGAQWTQDGELQRWISAVSETSAWVPLLKSIEEIVKRFGAEVLELDSTTGGSGAVILRIPVPTVRSPEPLDGEPG